MNKRNSFASHDFVLAEVAFIFRIILKSERISFIANQLVGGFYLTVVLHVNVHVASEEKRCSNVLSVTYFVMNVAFIHVSLQGKINLGDCKTTCTKISLYFEKFSKRLEELFNKS